MAFPPIPPETDAEKTGEIPVQRGPRWGRRLAVLGALVVVVALVIGLTYWFTRAAGPHLNRAPFDEAVANLAKQPAVQYEGTLSTGLVSWNVRVTSHGEAVGRVTDDTGGTNLLTVAGTSYVEPPESVMDDLAAQLNNMPSSVLANKWLTSTRLAGDFLVKPVLDSLLPPAKLADRLRTALAGTWRFPTTADPATTMDGVPALMATTPLGDLYVTKDTPYRVLHLAPPTPLNAPLPAPLRDFGSGGSDTTTTPQTPAPTTTSPPTSGAHPADYRISPVDDSVNSGDTDFPAMTPADVDSTYTELETDVNDLATKSVNGDIRFTTTSQIDVNCDPTGCTNTAHVTGEVISGSDSTITTGKVTAVLTVENAVDDIPAGSCTTVATLTLSGSSAISCTNPAAGPLITSELAVRRAAAQTQAYNQSAAQGGGSVSVPYEVDYTGDAYVVATAQVDVPALEKTLKTEAGH